MSIYDQRDKPAYDFGIPHADVAQNPHVLSWWSEKHDDLIISEIAKMQWVWYWGIVDRIAGVTEASTLQTWRKVDPACRKHVWYNALLYFAVARAHELGLTNAIREPRTQPCILCGQPFREDSIPYPLVVRMGIDSLDACAPCLSQAIFGSGQDTPFEAEVRKYLREIADAIQRVPPQDFGRGMDDFQDMDARTRQIVLKLLQVKPSVQSVKTIFGSWLQGLISAGVLEDGAHRTARGVRCVAIDGHICFSLAEKTIDDLLHRRKLRHQREVKYPGCDYRADFRVGGVFIEYFGLTGDHEYDAKSRVKIDICSQNGIRLIAIYPRDLVSHRTLEEKLGTILGAKSLPMI